MIVKIAAWLYIINAALSLSSLTFSPFGMGGTKANLAILLMAGLCGAMGVGLLQQKSWARWLALGISFLGWTLGGLMLIVLFGYLIFVGGVAQYFGLLFSGGVMSLIVAIVLFILAIWIVSLVINFKLFFYLCSQEGCDEFDVPYGSGSTVFASAGAWVGIFIFNGMLTSGGSLAGLAAQSMASRDEDSQREIRQQEQLAEWRAQEARDRSRQRNEANRQREEQERARVAEIEAATLQAEAADPQVGVQADVPAYEAPPEPAASYSQRPAAEKEDEAPASKRILKCRDSSGSITFTQGYCPAGTKLVEMPASE